MSDIFAIQTLFGALAALDAARQAGLVAALIEGPATPSELSARLSLDRRATERVLDVLETFGLAAQDDARFSASAALAAWANGIPGGVVDAQRLWAHAPEFLRTGAPFLRMDADREGCYREVVSRLGSMFSSAARELAVRLARRPARVLDIGCGSGVWSLALAERSPATRVTGLDLPAVLESFRSYAANAGLVDRIDLLPGDVHAIQIPPRSFDLVVIANVLRIESPDRAADIVARAAAAVREGGEILVIDALAGGSPERERARAVYALHLAMRTERGSVHTADEIARWLASSGFSKVEEVAFTDVEALGALVARR